jgi:hypothetical protein
MLSGRRSAVVGRNRGLYRMICALCGESWLRAGSRLVALAQRTALRGQLASAGRARAPWLRADLDGALVADAADVNNRSVGGEPAL